MNILPQYSGVFKALEEQGLLGSIRRVAGTSAGALNGLFFALGVSYKQYCDYFWNISAMDYVTDGRALSTGASHTFRGLNNRMGVNEGHGLVEMIRDVCRKYTGHPDLTFLELFDLTGGRELVVTGTNLSLGTTEYFHVKTTPHMRICDA